LIRYRPSRVEPPPAECPLTACLALLGGAWTPNVVWYLREGPRRFNELRGDIAGISAKVLSARLRKLAADGVVKRHVMPTSPPTVEYELTELGRELLPAVDAIVSVGHRLKQRRQAAAST
jgi:DNA-binding HxlR family transcriptional regulator